MPSYLNLYESGELKKRAETLWKRLEGCDICPHNCRVNRLADERGYCRSGARPSVSSFCAHHGEEPVLSGTRGSGTLFFANCNMRCSYCQNYQISQDAASARTNEIDCTTLAERMLYLQDQLHCHNINLVSPSHFVPQIVQALLEAVPRGLRLPLVYNTGGYDALSTIEALEDIVDIYLPDMRYGADAPARKYSGVTDYVEHNREAIKEMYRQTGNLKTDEDEVAHRGVIVRHLILPSGISASKEALTWLAQEVSPEITISVMSQYYPCYRAGEFPELFRSITYEEYQEVADLVDELGMENGWLQEMDAPANYLPDFKREGHPFERR